MADQIMGGDLYSLWKVSDVYLPRVADTFFDAGRTLGGTDDGCSAFRADTTPSGGPSSAVWSSTASEWGHLRNELLSMYAQIGETVLAAAAGVRRAAQAYVDADMASADALSKYLANPANHSADLPAANPPIEGTDEHPGEPYLPSQ